VNASDVLGRALTYTASGLPVGLAINATSGLISGTPSARGRVESIVTVSDASASVPVAITWSIRR
jgi:hypothetical protein